MEKQVFYGSASEFGEDELNKLLREMGASELGETKLRQSRYEEEVTGRIKFYYLEKENIIIEYKNEFDTHWSSRITLRGSPKNVSLIEKKILDEISHYHYDADKGEYFRAD